VKNHEPQFVSIVRADTCLNSVVVTNGITSKKCNRNHCIGPFKLLELFWCPMLRFTIGRVLLCFFLGMVLVSCKQKRMACVYEIPKNYTGWVLIEYSKANCSPLPVKDDRLILHLDENGRLCTSSELQTGWAIDEYFYVGSSRTKLASSAWGGGGRIWGESTGSVSKSGVKDRTFGTFFVGTEEEFKRATPAPIPD
jgi:hypothetical protein